MTDDRRKTFMSLYEPVHARFERFCQARAYGQTDWKDLMQDVVIVAFNRLEELKNPAAFLSFLCGIAIRLLSNQNRKKREDYLAHHERLINSLSCSDDDGHALMNRDLLYTALSRLPEQQRETIILFELSGFSIREIAEMQSSGESAVKQRLLRGRQQLMVHLQSLTTVNESH
ncbi:MAG: RNA polymerase sigma factor [Bacteroidota bacterium]